MRKYLSWFNHTENAAALAILVNVSTVVGELIVGLIVGSIAIIADALHGGIDLFTSVMAFASIRFASRPPDRAHPFGHGKIEDVSATAESFIIMGGGIFVLYQAYGALFEERTLSVPELGIAVVAIEMLLKLVVSQHMLRVAKREGSTALAADAQHIRADILTSVGAIIGLVGYRITGWAILDPLAAVLISFLIIRAGIGVLRTAFGGLIDTSLDDSELATIQSSVRELAEGVCDFHTVRSRRAGRQRLIDLHLVVPKDLNIQQAHDLSDALESAISAAIPMVDVTVHLEPCDMSADECATHRAATDHLVDSPRRGPGH